MANLNSDKPGLWRVLYYDGAGKRHTLRLGKIAKRQAESIKGHVEQLVSSQITRTPPPAPTACWVSELDAKLFDRLAHLGLVQRRQEPAVAPPVETLGPFVAGCIANRSGVESSTKEIYERAAKNLIGYFGADKQLADVSEGDAIEFWNWLLTPTGGGLQESTARKRCSHASMFFLHAVRKRLIAENPFDNSSVPKANIAAQDYVYVPTCDAVKILDQLPNAQWRLLFGLSRWGGLRVGSEPRALTWADIDWNGRRFTVHARKTRRHRGHETRVVPIFPELAELFSDRYADATPGDILVLPFLVGRSDASLRDTMTRAIKRAGVAVWPRLWQNLRSTRQTELEDRFPGHVVCRWLGNSAKVAEKHYLRTNDGHFAAAADWPADRPDSSGAVALPVALHAHAWGGKAMHDVPTNSENPRNSEENANQRRSGRDSNPR